jgi:hypothetical protein
VRSSNDPKTKQKKKFTVETGSASAMIFANEIDASSSIKTVMAITVVDIVLTLAAVKTFNTATGVVARCVLAAERVSAQLRHRTLVNICKKKKKKNPN